MTLALDILDCNDNFSLSLETNQVGIYRFWINNQSLGLDPKNKRENTNWRFRIL